MKKILILILVCVIGYFSLFLTLGLLKGYNWDDMDWDNSGMVGVFEIMRSTDIGMKENEKGCKEYYSQKDGLTVKEICEN